MHHLHSTIVRFPRFHFGTAIALGLMMLCMSSVPVFADGLSAPTLSATVNGSTISLSWNVPGATLSFVVRRDTGSAPANTSAGTLVLTTADNTTTTYSDTGLANGTYYYSVFGINGGLTSLPGSAGPLTVNVTDSGGGGTAEWLYRLRQQNGLDMWGNPLPTSSASSASVSSVSSVASSSSSAGTIHPAAPSTSTSSSSASVAQTPFQIRTCDRAMKWFRENASTLGRLNARLKKHFGFTCGE